VDATAGEGRRGSMKIIALGGKHKYVGYADTAEEAYEKYKAAVVKYHGEFGQPK
jgi:hypothetical protein